MKSTALIKFIAALLLGLCLTYIAGCTVSKNPQDPFEGMNRKIFAFNVVFDNLTVRPIAIVYTTLTPKFFQTGMNNALSNARQVPTIANNLLQGNLGTAIRNVWRLIFNTTFGVGGLFDVATKMGLPENHQDFGLTLAKWGAKRSPYLVLPFIGPSTYRDAFAYPLNEAMSIWPYLSPAAVRWGALGGRVVITRAQFLPADKLIAESFDPYVFVRNAYLQNRNAKIDKNAQNGMTKAEEAGAETIGPAGKENTSPAKTTQNSAAAQPKKLAKISKPNYVQ